MSTPYPDARSWAQDHSLANVPRLARLEGVAFQAHPEIVAGFGADGQAMARVAAAASRSSGARTIGTAVMVVLFIAALIAPVLGVAIYGDAPAYVAPTAEPYPADVAVPISSVCFMIAALTQLVCAVLWLRRGALWEPGLLVISAATAVLAGFAAIGLPNVADRDGFDLGAWIVPVWLTIAIGGLLALGIVLRRAVRAPDTGPERTAPPRPTVSDRERSRMLVRALPDAERQAVQDDRDAALRILAERGLLDDETLGRALDADLGTLFVLDPIQGDPT